MSARLDSCRAKAGAILSLVFVVGLTTGFLATHLMTGVRAETVPHAARVNSTLGELIDRLNLRADQIEQVRCVLDDTIMVEAEMLSEIKSNQMEGRRRIMEFLDPAQKERFEALIEGAQYAPLE